MKIAAQTFRKGERLCSKKLIAELFNNGRSFYYYPFQVIWIRTSAGIPFPAQVAVSVSKRSFKKAVDRNTIRRRIKEAWRKNKHILYEFLEKRETRVVFIIIYKEQQIEDYSQIEKNIIGATRKLISEITSKEPQC